MIPIIPRGSQVSRFTTHMPLQGCEAYFSSCPQDDMDRFFRFSRMVTRSQSSFCQLFGGWWFCSIPARKRSLVKVLYVFTAREKLDVNCKKDDVVAIITKINSRCYPKQKSYMPWIYPPPPTLVVCCCQVLVLQRLVVTIGTAGGDWVLKSLRFFQIHGIHGTQTVCLP